MIRFWSKDTKLKPNHDFTMLSNLVFEYLDGFVCTYQNTFIIEAYCTFKLS